MEDTPTRSKSGCTPLSKIEDSPVFNFMNNLSPIQPVKTANSVHIAHTHQSLNLASLSSVFSSPHANPPRETRILSRPSFADFSKHESISSYASENGICSEVSDVVRPSSFTTTAQENCTVTCLLNEAIIDSPDQCQTLPSTSSQPVQYVSGSPDHITTPSYVVKSDIKVHIGHTPADFVTFVQNGVDRQKNLFAVETDVQEDLPFQLNDDKVVGGEMIGCDWENLITDEAEALLIFDTSMESEAHDEGVEKAADNDGNSFVSLLPNCTENDDSLHTAQGDVTHGRCVQNTNQDRTLNHSKGSMKKHDTDHATKMLPGTSQSQVDNHLQRGMRRRCLVFDVAGVSIANMRSESNLKPSTSLSSKCKSIRDANNWRASVSPSLCTLPGIGLHLNTLASTSKDRMASKETGASGKQQISTHFSIDPFPSTTAERNNHSKLPIEKDHSPTGKDEELQIVPYDAEKDATLSNCEELSQDSPKRKRRKSENGGESDGCNRCNCKKSKCLKLYCVCFAAGVYCSEPCSCQGCFNKPIHEETVLSTRKQIESRNPLAFAPKVIQPSEAGPEMGDDNNKTPASARHKRGCNCKKSNCLKKYCECYQGGVGCSIGCRCEGCKNAFGRKDGTLPGVEEIEQAEEEIGACDKENESIDDQQNANMLTEEHFSGIILPLTPHQSCRLSIDRPLFSSAKPPRITKLSIIPSPGLYGSRMLQKSEILLPEHKSENNAKTCFEDDTPDILKPSVSPAKGIKIASPNCKRVSPPHHAVGLSPNRKGCRKLILKSIPSFPSLNNDAASSEYPVNYPNSSFSSSS